MAWLAYSVAVCPQLRSMAASGQGEGARDGAGGLDHARGIEEAYLFRQDMDMHACVHVCGQMLHVRWIGSVDHACSSSVYVCIHHKINGPGRKGKLIFQK